MRSTQHKPEFRISDRQRGAVLLLVTFSLVVFFGLAALVIDLGRMYIVKSQLQNAADAGALRAALRLNGTRDGVWMAGRPNTSCHDVNATGNPCGIEGALTNRFLLAAEELLSNEVVVQVASHPSGPWFDPATVTGPNDYYYAKVETAKIGISSFFAGIIGVEKNGAQAVAIAGRFVEGQMLPLFVPIVRRNGHLEKAGGTWQLNASWSGNQTSGLTADDCRGEIYDPKEYSAAKGCPDHESFTSDPDKQFRGPDPSGDWGLLRPGQTFAAKYLAATGQVLPSTPATGYYDNLLTSGGAPTSDVGTYYIIKPEANAKALKLWAVPAAWTGNFGWTLSDPPDLQQKTIQEAVCRGAAKQVYPVPGCADIHPGGLSDPQFVKVINTRFNIFPSNDPDVTPALCPSDKVITEYADPPPSGYDIYKNEPGTVSTGATGRRLIRVYVVDNAWLYGYDEGKSLTCRPPLTGGSRPAHVVGCAEFLIFKKSDQSDGLLYAEFVRRVSDAECKLGAGPGTFNEIRLYR